MNLPPVIRFKFLGTLLLTLGLLNSSCLIPLLGGTTGTIDQGGLSENGVVMENSATDTSTENVGTETNTVDPVSGTIETNYESEAGTFSLPVTISKLESGSIPTVDHTTINFQLGNNSLGSMLLRSTIYATTTPPIGAVSFQLSDTSCRSVGVIMDGAFIDTISGDSSADCFYKYYVPSDMIDKIVTFVTLGDGTTLDNGGTVSYPLSVRINSPRDLLEDYNINAFITLLDSHNNTDGLKADIQETSVGYITSENIQYFLYPALTDGTTPALWYTPMHGGYPEEFVTTPSLIKIIESLNKDAFIVDENDTVSRLFGDTSSVSYDLIDPTAGITKSTFAIDSSNTYLAYERDSIEGTGFGIYKITTGEVFVPGDHRGQIGFLPTKYEMTWEGQSSLVIIASDETNYALLSGDITGLVSDSEPIVLRKLYTSTKYIGSPNVLASNSKNIFLLCENDSGITDVCRFNTETLLLTTTVSAPGNIESFDISTDGFSYIVFETDGQLGIRKLNDEESITYIARGRKPSVSPYSDTIINYFEDMDEVTQVGIYNLNSSYLITPPALSLTPHEKYISTNSQVSYMATGGMPPYIYMVKTGPGSIEPTLGTYISDTAGDAVITVTDNIGSTESAIIHIGAPGDLDLSFSTNGIFALPVASTVSDTVVLSGGQILVCGSINTQNNRDYFVAKITERGELDTSFADNGIYTFDFGGQDTATAIGVLSNGKVIVGGETLDAYSHAKAGFLMLTSSGVPDTGFGANGVQIASLPNNNILIKDLLIDSSDLTNKIVATGFKIRYNNRNADVLVMKFDSAGNLDTTFNSTGIFTADAIGGPDKAYAITQHNGYYYLAGEAEFKSLSGISHCFVMKLTDTGSTDTTVGKNGLVEFQLSHVSAGFSSCNDIVITNDAGTDRVYVGGSYTKSNGYSDWALLDLDTDLSSGLNPSTIMETSFGNARVSGIAAINGDVFIAGSVTSGNHQVNATTVVDSTGIQSLDYGDNGLATESILSNSITERMQGICYNEANDMQKQFYLIGNATLADGSTQAYVYRIWR